MKKIMVIILFLISLKLSAEEWELGNFISVTPTKGTDVTFQILDDFDPKQRVLLGWDGDEQLYAMAIDEQPGGLDTKKYWKGLLREIEKDADGQKLDVAHEGEFKSNDGLTITYKVITSKSDGEILVQIIYLIKNSKIAYWAMVIGVDVTRVNEAYQQSASVLKTVKLTK